jgi:uncharacterized protein (TIGR02147 family)
MPILKPFCATRQHVRALLLGKLLPRDFLLKKRWPCVGLALFPRVERLFERRQKRPLKISSSSVLFGNGRGEISMTTRDNLTQFLDFRTFLMAHAQEQKRRNPHWTYGAWARRLGLKGTASLTRVVQGLRQPGPQMVESFVKYFQFSEKESEYFRDLIRLARAKEDTKLSTLIMEKMGKRFANASKRVVDEKTFNTISNWYYFPIREMLRLPHFKEDVQWIAKQLLFKVNPRDVAQALRTLQDLGFVKRNSEGWLELSEGRLNTGDDVANEAVKRHHEEMLANARTSLRATDVGKREITSQTIAISSQKLAQAKELIRQFQEKFSEIMEDERGGDVIYQMQIQFFPLTREVKSHEEKQESQFDEAGVGESLDPTGVVSPHVPA